MTPTCASCCPRLHALRWWLWARQTTGQSDASLPPVAVLRTQHLAPMVAFKAAERGVVMCVVQAGCHVVMPCSVCYGLPLDVALRTEQTPPYGICLLLLLLRLLLQVSREGVAVPAAARPATGAEGRRPRLHLPAKGRRQFQAGSCKVFSRSSMGWHTATTSSSRCRGSGGVSGAGSSRRGGRHRGSSSSS
jgi:hypothetical protein